MRIILTGGGSGGHLYPLAAVAEKIKEKLGPDAEFLFLGPKGEMERRIMKEYGIPVRYVAAGKIRRYFSWLNFTDIFKTAVGFLQSLWVVLWFMPEAVFAKGGYASVPVVLAAWIYRIPVLMHESDAVPGISNRFLSRFATRIAVSYDSALAYFSKEKTALVGNPVRADLLGGDPVLATKKFNLVQGKPVVLVLGGSQGSQALNDAVVRILPRLLPVAQIIHQTGEGNYDKVLNMARDYGVSGEQNGYHPVKYFETGILKDVLAAADLVVSRAGANTITEIAAVGKPVILVPLRNAANNHQRMNAFEISKLGGGLVLEEGNLGENIFFQRISELIDDRKSRARMGDRIRVFYRPEASEKLARGIIEMIKH